MRYFYLPNNNNIINKNDIIIKYDNNEPIICFSLINYLTNSKNKINNYIEQWDNYKKYTNTYEFIQTHVPNSKISISKYKPLSRSYFKMIEILNTFKILDPYLLPINTFHLAEGPGGFIEALASLRKNKNDKYTGITLHAKDNSIPNWNKCKDIIKKYNNIFLEFGKDGTGDILSPDNLKYCFEKYSNKMDIITGDGGFDFSIDFNNQETLASNLIFAEICFAILLQKKGGTFILKYFDIFHKSSIDLLYILNSFYYSVIVSKLYTSRSANSEKYIICKNFKYDSTTDFFDIFYKIFTTNDLKKKPISNFLNISIPYIFINKIEEINCLLGQLQIENINNTIDLINSKSKDKLESLKQKNIAKCIDWCVKNNISHNTLSE